MIRVMVVDDDLLICESLKMIMELSGKFEVVGLAEDGKTCIDLLYRKQVDVDIILLDMNMPVMSGLDVLKYLYPYRHQNKHPKILILTTFDEEYLIEGAIEYGAVGYLLKNSKPEKIMSALESVANGSGVYETDIIRKIGQSNKSIPASSLEEYHLSNREQEIVQLIAKGYSNKEISAELFISEGTVKNYITSILAKMDLKHRTQIAITYLKQK